MLLPPSEGRKYANSGFVFHPGLPFEVPDTDRAISSTLHQGRALFELFEERICYQVIQLDHHYITQIFNLIWY